MVAGVPRMCMSTSPAPAAATTRAISGSPSALTSLTAQAPASSARAATSALVVSTDSAGPSASAASRRQRSAAGTGDAPGRVLSAPRTMRSAPSAASASACPAAARGSRVRPPSENESGVTLTIPMTRVRASRSKRRSRQCQITSGLTGSRKAPRYFLTASRSRRICAAWLWAWTE